MGGGLEGEEIKKEGGKRREEYKRREERKRDIKNLEYTGFLYFEYWDLLWYLTSSFSRWLSEFSFFFLNLFFLRAKGWRLID